MVEPLLVVVLATVTGAVLNTIRGFLGSDESYDIKKFFGAVVRILMTDDEIVKLVWEVMVLKRRFEDNPYSLSVKQIELLKDHENRRYLWHYVS